MSTPLRLYKLLVGLALATMPVWVLAQGLPAVTVQGGRYSLTLELLALLTVLTLIPSLVLMMTSFVRIIIVMSILRQALGTGSTPPNQVLVGLSLFLTIFIMSPILTQVWETGIQPYLQQTMPFDQALANVRAPIHAFMMSQTREDDLAMFLEIARQEVTGGPETVPFATLVPAFLTSELKSAFTIGFLIYIPFVVLDLVVASVLMSMGMMMISPMMISMPFKLMLFVLVDGRSLIMGSMAASFVNP
jgi:flagellar biosynthetic protein FliP